MAGPLFPELPEITEAVSNPSAADYALAAKYALKRKQRPLAVQQVSAAIALEPDNDRHLQLLSDIVSTTPDPLALLALPSSGAFYGLVAARAWMLARRTHTLEATQLLTQVIDFRPNIPFLSWLRRWSERFDWDKRVPPDAVAQLLRTLAHALIRDELLDGGEQNIQAAIDAAAAVQAANPQHSKLKAARISFHRQLNESDEALRLATEGPKSWETELEVARVFRSLGDSLAEARALEEAITLAPHEALIYQELATAYVLSGDRRAAEETLRRANSQAPAPWSSAALRYLEWLRMEESPPAPELPGEEPAFERDTRCLIDLLPDPVDPLVGVVRRALLQAATPGGPQRVDLNVNADCLAPSACRAFELGLAASGKQGALRLRGAPQHTAFGRLWAFQGDSPVAQLPPPDPMVAAVVTELAMTRFRWQDWLPLARSLLKALPPTVQPSEFVSVALHPPAAPASADAVQWLVHIHTATGILLGCHDAFNAELSDAIHTCLEAKDDWVCNIGLVAVHARLFVESSEQTIAASRWLSDVGTTVNALLPKDNGNLPAYARVLAIVGATLPGSNASTFHDLRARIVFATARGDA